MTLIGVPWFVDGADHGPEVARLLAYLSIGGNDGVVQPGDFKVTASPIPDGNIHIAPGAMGYQSRYAGADSEGYLVMNDGDQAKALDPQGSGGVRYDLICIITQDPHFPAQPAPASVPDGPYNIVKVYKNVAATTEFIEEVDANQSGYAIARVKFDASDGTVVPADITDLRQLVVARQKIETRIANGSGNVNLPAVAAVAPPEASWNVKIPKWATRVILEGYVSGLYLTDTSAGGGSAQGAVRVGIGAVFSNDSQWRADANAANKPITQSGVCGGEFAIPEAMRGTTVALTGQAWRTSLIGMTAMTTTTTAFVVKATFFEAPE